MGMPVKLSDELVRLARQEAEQADRSITAQIEHWAKLGRAVEVALGYQQTTALKTLALDVGDPHRDSSKRDTVLAVLEQVAGSSDRTTVVNAIRASERSVFGTDPTYPGMIVRQDPDGTRTLGRFVSGQFVPGTQTAANPAKTAAKRKIRPT